MIGVSSTGKDNIGKIVDNLFDNIALQLIGEIPRLKNKKLAIISMEHHFGLANLFIKAMQDKTPNQIEQDLLRGLLKSTDGYIEALKNKTRSNITEAIDGLAREAASNKTKVDEEKFSAILKEEMSKARSHMAAIVESEASKLRNLGTLMNISRMATSVNDSDPTVYFQVIKDTLTCKECIRLHLMPDQTTPRLWKFSELKQGYHKRNEDHPSAFGLHPHCFVENTKLHTESGLISIKELFDSQKKPKIFVDNRIKNRVSGGNQYGKPISGAVWMDRHASGTRLMEATQVYDTGRQNCLKITLSNGFSLSVSEGHEMWVDSDQNGVKIIAKELKIGDKIPLISGECGFGEDDFAELAELMGNLMGDGIINDHSARWMFFGHDIPYGQYLHSLAKKIVGNSHFAHELTIMPPNQKYSVESASFNSSVLKNVFVNDFKISKKPRHVPERIWKASKNTVSSFLRGLYAADGHSEKSPNIILTQNDLEFLKEIQLLLSNFGLIATIAKHGEECEKYIEYADGTIFKTKRKECWRLMLGGWDQCAIFFKEIGMGVPIKNERLMTYLSLTEGKNRHGSWRTSRIESIEELGIKQTYCLTEPMSNTVTANGFVTGQCRCTLVYLSKGFGFDEHGKTTYESDSYDAYIAQRKD